VEPNESAAGTSSATTLGGWKDASIRDLIEHAGDGFLILAANRLISEVNQSLCDLVGFSREEIIGRSPLDFVHESSLDQTRIRMVEIESTRSRVYRTNLRRKDGSACPVLIRSITQRDAQGNLLGSLGFVTDLSEIVSAQNAVTQSERELRSILDNMLDTYYRTNAAGELVRASASAEKLLGYKPEELIGMKLGDFYATTGDRDRFLATLAANGGVVRHYEAPLKRRDGSLVWVSTNARVLIGADGKPDGVEGTTRDITEFRRAQEHIHFMAHHDALTELPNRRFFKERVDRLITRGDRGKGLIALLFVDLDHFKDINDNYGHEVGDEVLRSVAQRLVADVRETDVVCRHGGDEFLIALGEFQDRASLLKQVERVMHAINGSYSTNTMRFDVSCTIGVAVYPHDGLDCETLMRRADYALYQAKGEGRRRYALFEPDVAARN
jgi:diguanylate cyclase (GGDEF)-like protein/PAS domain S-box-containing protein